MQQSVRSTNGRTHSAWNDQRWCSRRAQSSMCVEVWHALKIWGQVARCRAVEAAIHQHCQPKRNTFWHPKPVIWFDLVIWCLIQSVWCDRTVVRRLRTEGDVWWVAWCRLCQPCPVQVLSVVNLHYSPFFRSTKSTAFPSSTWRRFITSTLLFFWYGTCQLTEI